MDISGSKFAQLENHIKIIQATEQDEKMIRKNLVEYNRKQVPEQLDFIPVRYVLKNSDDEIIGGIIGRCYWDVLGIELFWLDEDYRGQGLGTQLLQAAEKKAMELNCNLVHLDTFEFQAKDFYVKNGYEVFGVLEDCPKGYYRYYLKNKPS